MIDLSLWGFAPAQSQIHFARETNKGSPRRSHVTRDCYCHVVFRDMTTDFCWNWYSKNRLICDCAGQPTHAITTLLSNSLSWKSISTGKCTESLGRGKNSTRITIKDWNSITTSLICTMVYSGYVMSVNISDTTKTTMIVDKRDWQLCTCYVKRTLKLQPSLFVLASTGLQQIWILELDLFTRCLWNMRDNR